MEKFYPSDENNEFEKLFREKLYDFEALPPEGAFERIFAKSNPNAEDAELDNLLREKLYDFAALPSDDAFEQILDKVAQDSKRKRRIALWWYSAAASVCMALVSVFYFANFERQNVAETKNKTRQSPDQKAHQTKKISEADIAPAERIAGISSEKNRPSAEDKISNVGKSSVLTFSETAQNLKKQNSVNLTLAEIPKSVSSGKNLGLSEGGKNTKLTSNADEINDSRFADAKPIAFDFFEKLPEPSLDLSSLLAPEMLPVSENALVGKISCVIENNNRVARNAFFALENAAGFNLKRIEVNLPENIKLQSYKSESLASVRYGAQLRTRLSNNFSLTLAFRQFFLRERVLTKEAPSTPEDYVRNRLDSFSVAVTPVFRYENQSYDLRASYLNYAAGIRHDKSMGKRFSRFWSASIAHYALLDSKVEQEKDLDRGLSSDTFFAKNLISTELQGGIRYAISQNAALYVAGSLINFHAPVTRGTQVFKMQNLSLTAGLEVRLW